MGKKVKFLLPLLLLGVAFSLAGWKMGGWKQTEPKKQMAADALGQVVWENPEQALRINTMPAVGADEFPAMKSREPYMARLSGLGRFIEGEIRGSAVLEDEDYIYLYSGCEIRKISKENKEVSVIWQSSETETISLTGKAVLIGDKIFFLENWWARGLTTEALSVINTDGTGYGRIEEKKNYGGFLYFSDGILYAEDGKSVWEYGIYTDGTWEKIKTLTGNVSRALPNALKTGMVSFFNEKFYLIIQEENLYLTDRETQKRHYFVECDGSVIGMDEEYVYLCRSGSGWDGHESISYEKVAIADGEERNVFFQDGFSEIDCIRRITGADGMSLILGSYIYYVEESDYGLYLARRSLDDPSERERLGQPFFDSGIGEVGRVDDYSAKIRSEVNPDCGWVSVDLERLVVDGRFPGAADINRVFSEIQENIILYEEDNLLYVDELLGKIKDPEFGSIHYSYISVLSPVFRCGRCISFYQEDDDYTGGLHGCLTREGYTFDLLTGKRLTLEDVVGNSEEEINNIVVQYFASYINEHPEAFWEDAVDIVRERIGMESDFYLTEDGICFYLPPYAIAAFAGGFQEVTVPYEVFEMKIMLEERYFSP